MLESGTKSNRVENQPLLIDRRLFEVWFAGAKIALTATEFDLLSLLFSEHDRVVSREEILERVWGDGRRGLRVVDTYVSRVRTKLRHEGHPGVISVRKRGYRLAGAISRRGIDRPTDGIGLEIGT